MECVFVESSIFEKYSEDHLSDDEYRLFQAGLMSNLKQGDVIQGTGGLRKASVVVPELSITSSMKNDVAICSQFMERVECQI